MCNHGVQLGPSFIHLLVAFEDRRRDKGLLAQVALVLLVSVVHHLDVDVERVFSLEGGVALVTLECPLTCGKESGSFVGAIFCSAFVFGNTVITHSKRAPNFTEVIVWAENCIQSVSLQHTDRHNAL